MLSVVAGARRALGRTHATASSARSARACRSASTTRATRVANHDSFFSVGVPLNEPDPVARLRDDPRRDAASASSTRMPSTASASARARRRAAARAVRHADRAKPAALRAERLQRPGPPRPVSVLGAPVVHLHSIAEIGERHALRVSATSLAEPAVLRPLRRPRSRRRVGRDGRGHRAGGARAAERRRRGR